MQGLHIHNFLWFVLFWGWNTGPVQHAKLGLYEPTTPRPWSTFLLNFAMRENIQVFILGWFYFTYLDLQFLLFSCKRQEDGLLSSCTIHQLYLQNISLPILLLSQPLGLSALPRPPEFLEFNPSTLGSSTKLTVLHNSCIRCKEGVHR